MDEKAEEVIDVVAGTSRATCVICGGCKYVKPCVGMLSCNACYKFLRRAVALFRNPDDIRKKMDITSQYTPRFEKLQELISSGMLSAYYDMTKSADVFLGRVLKHMDIMNLYRDQKFECTSVDNITPTQAIENYRDPIRYSKKPSGGQMTCVQWCLLNQIISVDFLKKFEVVRHGFLSTVDAEKFLKGAYIRSMIFSTAWRNYHQKEECMRFPGGVDVFSDEVNANRGISEGLKTLIRGQLIAAMRRIKMDKEEFQLLSAIFAMTSAGTLSANAQKLLTIHKTSYNNALVQYCQLKAGSNWKSRFQDLLGICTVVNSTFEKLSSLATLYMTLQPHSTEKEKFEHLTKFAEVQPE